jgi:hypothetical protein
MPGRQPHGPPSDSLNEAGDSLNEAGASDPGGVFVRVLHLIDRTVFPRRLLLQSGSRLLTVDVGNRGILICPHIQGRYVLDDVLKRTAPYAYDVLTRGMAAAVAASATLEPEGKGLLAQSVRTLEAFCAAASLQHMVKPLPRECVVSMPRFSALDVLRAAAKQLDAGSSVVQDFFRRLRPPQEDLWLIRTDGWPVGLPKEVTDLNQVEAAQQTVRTFLAWRRKIPDLADGLPTLGVLGGPPNGAFWCVAADRNFVALVRKTAPGMLGYVLSDWQNCLRGGSAA